MHSRRASIGLLILVVAGIAISALAFVPAWISHDRVVLGEGARRIHTDLAAWDGQAVPVLAAGVILAAVAAILALGRLVRPGIVPRVGVVVAASVAAGLLLSGVGPVSQEGHASSVTLGGEWALFVAVGVGAIGLGAAVMTGSRALRLAGVTTAVVLLVAGGGWGGRILALNLAEGTGRHYTDGSYTRQATGGEPTETLTFRNGTITVDGRWSGEYEGSGRVVSITGDPACPDVRGSYHVDAAGTAGAITWEKIIDTCAGGARARDLQAGIWDRVP